MFQVDLLCFLFVVLCIMYTNGAGMNSRLRIIESRVNTLEERVNIGSEDISRLQHTVTAFNGSVSDLENRICIADDKVLDGDDRKNDHELASAWTQHKGERLLLALGEEKSWVRKEIQSLTDTVDAFKMDIAGSVNKITNSDRDQVAQSELMMKSEVGELKHVMLNLVAGLKDEATDILSRIREVDTMVQTLEEVTNKNSQRSIDIAETINRLETKIYKEITQIQTQLKINLVCPPTWKQFVGNCYILHSDPESFDTAVIICAQYNARVAIAMSDDENEYLNTLRGQPIWIGARRKGNDQWTLTRNGKQLTYTNWDQKSQIKKFFQRLFSTRCGVMQGYTWTDGNCSRDTFAFVCKKMVN